MEPQVNEPLLLSWRRGVLIERLHDLGVMVGFRLALIAPEFAVPELEQMVIAAERGQ